MSQNQYENFKQGVKSDIAGAAFGLYAVIGLLTLILSMISVFIVIFYKENHFSPLTKTLTGIGLIALTITLIFNKRIGNTIYRLWLAFLTIMFIIIVAGLAGTIIYVLFKNAFTDFF